MSENNNASETGDIVEPAVTVTVEPAKTAAMDEPAVQATTATTATTAKTASSSPPQKSNGSSSGSIFGSMLTLLLLIAVAGLGYGYWQQKTALDSLDAQYAALAGQVGNSSGQFTSLQENQQQIGNSLQEMENSLQEMQQQLQQTITQQEQNQQQAQQQLLTQLGESSSRIASLAAQLNTVNTELATTRQQVSQLGNQTTDSVMLSEAEALVELAQQRLLTARDVKAASTLMVSSDEVLARVQSIDVTAARTVLAADLTNMKAAPEVDVQALYRQLADVRAQVNGLSVVSGSDNPDFAVPQTNEAEPEESGWFDSALSVLGEYFVVTREDVEVVPLLTEEQQFLLRQNIELQLTSAQLALLNSEPEVYRTALAAARDGVSQWLQGPEGSKAEVLDALARLQETPIVVSMPDISASLNAIRQIIPLASTTVAPAAAEVVP